MTTPAPPVQSETPASQPGWITRAYNRAPALPNQARGSGLNSPKLPGVLSNRAVIFNSWMISMAVISFDEWHNNNILPRPARLWDASLFFGLLALASIADAVVPLANAFAVGYTIMLIWQYFNGGSLAGGATGGNAGTTQVSGTTGSGSKAGGKPKT